MTRKNVGASGRVPGKPKQKVQKNRGSIPAGRRMENLSHPSEVNRMANKEYVTDWGATTSFALTPFTVQPRNTLLFPRLSAIAERYEKYQFKKLIFRYRTQAVTTDSGSAFMYFDPDCYDTAADTKLVVLNHRNSARNKLYEDFELRIDSKDLGPVRFLRSIAASTGDQNLYDAGILRLGAISSAAKIVGELEVEYEIDLISPNIDPENLVDAVEDFYNSSTQAAADDDLSNVFSPDALAESISSYLVPQPEVTGGGGTSALALRGLMEFVVELYLIGTGITAAAALVSNAPSGEKLTIDTPKTVFNSTSLWQQWAVYCNNPSSIKSLLTFTSLVATTLTTCYLWVRPVASTAAPPTSFRRLARIARIKGRPVTEDTLLASLSQLHSLRTPPTVTPLSAPAKFELIGRAPSRVEPAKCMGSPTVVSDKERSVSTTVQSSAPTPPSSQGSPPSEHELNLRLAELKALKTALYSKQLVISS